MNQPKRTIQTAQYLRKHMTDAEKVLWDMLRGPQCPVKFRRQHPITPYVVDFYCPERKLIIEADGGQHANNADQVRDEFLKQSGYRICRFWNHDILQNREGVWAHIEQALNETIPHPALPLEGGGE